MTCIHRSAPTHDAGHKLSLFRPGWALFLWFFVAAAVVSDGLASPDEPQDAAPAFTVDANYPGGNVVV